MGLRFRNLVFSCVEGGEGRERYYGRGLVGIIELERSNGFGKGYWSRRGNWFFMFEIWCFVGCKDEEGIRWG